MVIVRFAGTTWPRYFQVTARPSISGSKRGVAQPVGHAALEHVQLEQLAQRLDAERAGLHRVLEEVRLEEPLARIDVLLGAQVAEPLAAARRATSR